MSKKGSKMKNKIITLSTMIFVFLALTGICQAQGLKLKFTGGYGTMKIGDYNTFGEGWDTFLKDILEIIETSIGLEGTKEGEFKKINWGFEYEGELILSFKGGVGIGFGGGYIQRSKDCEMSIAHDLLGPIMSISINPNFTIIPVFLSVYFSPPSIAPVNFYLYGGTGYYFGKGETAIKVDYGILWEEYELDIKDQGLGFHGGVGLEFNIAPKIAFFIEGKGRYCKLKSWEGIITYEYSDGTTSEEGNGTMWYYEILMDTILRNPVLELSENQPSLAGIENVREFGVDLSGFSIRGGIRIKF